MKFKRSLLSVLVAVAVVPAFAESTLTTNAATNSTATANVDITVIVPAVLSLRVGTGGAGALDTSTTVDNIVFTVPATQVASGTDITGVGGDLTAGAVTVRVFSNVGNDVTLKSTVGGQLVNAAGATIPWSQISVAAAALDSGMTTGFTNGAITHPAFSATSGDGPAATTLTAASGMVRREGKWTYTYLNDNPVAAGTYGGVNVQNGRILYTATQL